jgi:NaMN:DMB phosphoribosyltransferase
MAAIAAVGDPMIPAAAGFIIGAARKVPVLMAGGTQMAAVLSIIKAMEPEVMGNIALGTTKWIVNDKTSDIRDLVRQSGRVPILAANFDFTNSRLSGLRIYETGLVKEGVGCGGATIAAICSSKGKIDSATMLSEIEKSYDRLMTGAK